MKTSLLMNFKVDKENKKIEVEREFHAPVNRVWQAWTDSKMLDRWWAPKPWKAKTKTMDFRDGGFWLYAMQGPEGEEHWARADFSNISPEKQFSVKDAFCDSNGNIDHSFPIAHWNLRFDDRGNSTLVKIDINYPTVADLEKYIEMGFKEGFSAAMENLDEIFR
ncbi:MAG TPA: SRPBCC domain-containing protein [Lentimicrobium sp.]|nr:SRPBCC domain-containing protein [Lentimicrobium sp.]